MLARYSHIRMAAKRKSTGVHRKEASASACRTVSAG
jgi:hypothetical protein